MPEFELDIIESIEIFDSEDVMYDLSVEDVKSYNANGIIVHNSDICKRLNGQRVNPTETFVDPSTGEQFWHPPSHPNCRSTIIFVPEVE